MWQTHKTCSVHRKKMAVIILCNNQHCIFIDNISHGFSFTLKINGDADGLKCRPFILIRVTFSSFPHLFSTKNFPIILYLTAIKPILWTIPVLAIRTEKLIRLKREQKLLLKSPVLLETWNFIHLHIWYTNMNSIISPKQYNFPLGVSEFVQRPTGVWVTTTTQVSVSLCYRKKNLTRPHLQNNTRNL